MGTFCAKKSANAAAEHMLNAKAAAEMLSAMLGGADTEWLDFLQKTSSDKINFQEHDGQRTYHELDLVLFVNSRTLQRFDGEQEFYCEVEDQPHIGNDGELLIYLSMPDNYIGEPCLSAEQARALALKLSLAADWSDKRRYDSISQQIVFCSDPQVIKARKAV